MPASPPSQSPTGNKILASLGHFESLRFFPVLERVSLDRGEVIYEAETRIEHVYFPETAVFSMLATMENGDTVEVGPVGQEGMVGLRVFLGAETALYRVIVHVAGSALRLSAAALREELGTVASPMPDRLTRYTRMLLAMTGRSSACNKLHTLEQQLARWLMMISDYVGDELKLTHDLIALTLGVRRAGVTVAANDLRKAGTIDYQRGDIHLTDRRGLEAKACECYRLIKEEYDQLYADLINSARESEGGRSQIKPQARDVPL